jgi:hypothetical protein
MMGVMAGSMPMPTPDEAGPQHQNQQDERSCGDHHQDVVQHAGNPVQIHDAAASGIRKTGLSGQ